MSQSKLQFYVFDLRNINTCLRQYCVERPGGRVRGVGCRLLLHPPLKGKKETKVIIHHCKSPYQAINRYTTF